MSQTPAAKRRRADAGLMRVTERDLRLLRFIGEQYGVTLPQLATLMGRSNHAARWLRERWQRAGWAEGRAILVGHPVFVWLTGRGMKAVGIEHPLWRPTPGALAHVAAVNEVRIDVQARHPDAAWVSERELRRADPRLRVHRPDGLVAIGEREVAIEVELTQKERRRTARIMRELIAGYESVTYFAAPAPRRVLSGLAEKVGQGRVQVLPLPGEGSDESP